MLTSKREDVTIICIVLFEHMMENNVCKCMPYCMFFCFYTTVIACNGHSSFFLLSKSLKSRTYMTENSVCKWMPYCMLFCS